jgi:acyl dehydratase
LTTNTLGAAHTSESVRYLDEIELGQTWVTPGRTITETDVVMFGTWSGDMHPLHMNEEFAKQTQFGGRLFHGPGVLAMAFGLEMGLGWKNPSAIAFLGIRDWNLLAPVRIGDTIKVSEEIVEIRPSASKPDRGIVTTHVRVLKQNGEVCQEGRWIVLLSRRPDRSE